MDIEFFDNHLMMLESLPMIDFLGIDGNKLWGVATIATHHEKWETKHHYIIIYGNLTGKLRFKKCCDDPNFDMINMFYRINQKRHWYRHACQEYVSTNFPNIIKQIDHRILIERLSLVPI